MSRSHRLWQQHLRSEALRRLHLVAQTSETLLIVLRPLACAQDSSPAALRLAVRPCVNVPATDVKEVQFGRNVIGDIDVYFTSIHQAWREQNVGELVAIEKVRLLLIQQHLRQGVLAGLMPAPRKGRPPGPPAEPEPAMVD